MSKPSILLSSPHMGDQELRFVMEAFQTNWIAPVGPHIDAFEKELATYVESSEVAVLSSGTSALHLSMVLTGVEAGDYVICQSLTFSASANPIRYCGGIPIFVDSELDTWNMCPQALEAAIQACLSGQLPAPWTGIAKKPKAIIPVHLYGVPAKMDEILSIASKYDIPVVEDAAEALGSTIHGKSCGTFGNLGVLSFNGNKIITTSGGGALLSQDASYIRQAKYLATQARDEAAHYQHSKIGYNYRMSNVLAGIGRGQLRVLNERVEARRDNFEFYKNHLGGIAGIRFLEELPGSFANRWLTCILVDPHLTGGVDRELIRLALEQEKIESRPLWKPMHMQPVFDAFPYFGEQVAEKLFEEGLCLPSGSNLQEEDLYRVVEVIQELCCQVDQESINSKEE